MTLLKLKAKIYQYTGIYLVQKEEYITLSSSKKYNDLGTAIGIWQADNGFTREMSPLWMKLTIHRLQKNMIRYYSYSILNFIIMFLKQLRNDLYAEKKK